MNFRLWLSLSLVGLAGLLAAGEARAELKPIQIRLDEPSHPSHRLFDDQIPLGDPGALEDRLNRFRDMQRAKEAQRKELNAEMGKMAQRLLKENPKLLESLKGKVNADLLRRLKDQASGLNPAELGPLLKKLADDPELANKLTETDLSNIQKLLESANLKGINIDPGSLPGIGSNPGPGPGNPETNPPRTGPMPPPNGTRPESGPGHQHPPVPVTPPAQKVEGLSSGAKDWMNQDFGKLLDSVGEWVDSPSAEGWKDAFRDFGKRVASRPTVSSEFAGKVAGLTRYLPSPDKVLPRSALPDARLPSLPRAPTVTSPSLPGVPSLRGIGKSEGWGTALVFLLVVVLGVLLFRLGLRGWQARAARLREVGPWPVRPEEVSTAEQLVRAFEHLAILCLGPAARPRNHLDLAEQMGKQPDMDQERRQEAARYLAELYEKARYAPEGLPLPPDLLPRVRRELCYLAGVAAP